MGVLFGKKGRYSLRYRFFYLMTGKRVKYAYDCLKLPTDFTKENMRQLKHEKSVGGGKKYVVIGEYPDAGLGCALLTFLPVLAHWEKKEQRYIPILISDKNHVYESLFDSIPVENNEYQNDCLVAGRYYGYIYHYKRELADRIFRDRECAKKWSYFVKNYFPLNKETSNYVKKIYEKTMGDSDSRRILGVKFRRSDYKTGLFKGHAIQPTPEEMAEIAEENLVKYHYDYIFLSVEDPYSRDVFVNQFGEKVVFGDFQLPVFDPDKATSDCHSAYAVSARDNGPIYSERNYLADLFCLSRCDALVTTNTSGAAVAVAMNGGNYERIVFVNRGIARHSDDMSIDWVLGNYENGA